MKLMILGWCRRILAKRRSKHMCFTVQSGHQAHRAAATDASDTKTMCFCSRKEGDSESGCLGAQTECARKIWISLYIKCVNT